MLFGHFSETLSKKGDKFLDTVHHLETQRTCSVLSEQVALHSCSRIVDILKFQNIFKILS